MRGIIAAAAGSRRREAAASYEFQATDFLFDINDIASVYQDPLKETQVAAATNPVGYVIDVAT